MQKLDRLSRWCRMHWVLLINLVLVLLLIGVVAAPALNAAGFHQSAELIHIAYLLLCPQRPEHSYFLFGYQTALEHREIAMIGGLLIGGMIYSRMRPLSPLPFWALLVACIPISWDILTQMMELRESDWFTRTWTGVLSCLVYLFWLYPRIDPLFSHRPRHMTGQPGRQRRLQEAPDPTRLIDRDRRLGKELAE